MSIKPIEVTVSVTPIPTELYNRLCYLGIIDDSGVREHNVGNSDYSKHLIQPWGIWLEYPDLTPWDDDIIKRVLRTKAEGGMSPQEARIMDYKKIIHNCEERIRQINHDRRNHTEQGNSLSEKKD